MGFWNLLKFSTRMFKARTSRTFLTILGMGVGIGAILFLVALGFGIQRTLSDTITTADSLLTLDVYPGEASQSISQADIDSIRKIPGVNLVSPVFETTGHLQYGGLVTDAKVIAVDENFLDLEGLKVLQGEKISDNNSGVIISTTLAKIFEKTPEAMIGDNIKIFFESSDSNSGENNGIDYKIIGSVDKNDIVVYANQKTLINFFPTFAYSRLKVRCASSQAINGVRTSLTGAGFVVSALNDVIGQVEKTFEIVRIILGFFGAIALLVSAIGMFNTMVVTLMERTEEIGIMKSIGASDYDILWMFVFESTIMGFLGGVFGTILGFIAGEIVNIIFNIFAQRMGGQAISLFYFPAWFLLFIIAVATFVGFITGLIPARQASKSDPLEALRYK